MRTTPALRTLAAALFTAGTLAATAAGTTAAALPRAHHADAGHGSGDAGGALSADGARPGGGVRPGGSARTLASTGSVVPVASVVGSARSVWGTVVSRTRLSLRQAPTTHARVAGTLAPGSRDRVRCRVVGQSVNANPVWYWLVGAHAWAAAAFVDTGGRSVAVCATPCPPHGTAGPS